MHDRWVYLVRCIQKDHKKSSIHEPFQLDGERETIQYSKNKPLVCNNFNVIDLYSLKNSGTLCYNVLYIINYLYILYGIYNYTRICIMCIILCNF